MNALVRPIPNRPVSQSALHVVIIGGGIGGLTLAQGLKKAGVSVAVYERDQTRTDRVQGYRVHINSTGSLALHECLPAPLFETFTRTYGRPTDGIRFVTEQMKVLLALDRLNAPSRFGGDGVAQLDAGFLVPLLQGGGHFVRMHRPLEQQHQHRQGQRI